MYSFFLTRLHLSQITCSSQCLITATVGRTFSKGVLFEVYLLFVGFKSYWLLKKGFFI